MVFAMNKTAVETPSKEPVPLYILELQSYPLEFLQWFGSWFQFIIPLINRFCVAVGFTARERIGFANEILHIPHRIPPHPELEYAIPRSKAKQALKEIMRIIETNSLTINFIVEIRFVGRDEAWLSPDFERDSCHITLLIYNQPASQDTYFREFEKVVSQAGWEGRPHWAKTFFLTPTELRRVYPRWDSFQKVRAQLDPTGMFSNPFLDRVLGPIANSQDGTDIQHVAKPASGTGKQSKQEL
jgi:L-gulonolactone oxidase